jgi:hypothetical protein
VTIDSTLTLEGFKWYPTPRFVPTQPGENGSCVRDAFCQLLGWDRDSENWRRFIEAPKGTDLIRLSLHLGLTVFEVGAPGAWDELARRAAHPGVASFVFPKYWKSHTAYVPDVRWLLRYWPTPDGLPNRRPPANTGWPLGPEHMSLGPRLLAVIIDEREPSRGV